MDSRSQSKSLRYGVTSQTLLPTHQQAKRKFCARRFLNSRVFTYIGWLVIKLCTLLPFFFEMLKPLWRIIFWLAPTLLAIEVNAGEVKWVYVCKVIVWILQSGVAAVMLWATNGFQSNSDRVRVWAPLAGFLFLGSCVLTITGRIKKPRIPISACSNVDNFIFTTVKSATSLRNIDETVYAMPHSAQVQSKLSMYDAKNAWVADSESGRRSLTAEEFSQHIVWTSFMTQYVVSRVFKDVKDQVFVYSLVAQYRAILITIALILAGLVNISRNLFQDSANSDVVTSMVLWLTLPAITLPQIVRIKFGNSATLLHLWGGLLPVNTDKQMWQRLAISAEELYAALTNTFAAEKILKDKVGLVEGHGRGTMKVMNIEEAKRLSIRSLLRISQNYVRHSDGKRYRLSGPRELTHPPAMRVNLSAHSTDSESQQSRVSAESPAYSSSGEDVSDQTFSLHPDTRVLRNLIVR